jgi:cell division protein FtsB
MNALPSQVTNTIIPRFKSERLRIPDQYDPDTGLPMYRTVEMVELLIPGDKGNAPVKKVNDAIRAQYKAEYDRWKSSGRQVENEGNGLPLSQWPQLPKEIAAGLQHSNIFTVQQLAAMSDSQCQIKGTIGLRKYRDMASAFVDASKAAEPIARLSVENEALNRRISLLEEQLKKVSAIAEQQSEVIKTLKTETPSLETPDFGINEE